MIILFVAIFALAAAAIVILLKYKTKMQDYNEYCPEAEIFIECRKERKPCLALHDPGSKYTRFIPADKEKKTSWEYTLGEYSVKFAPDFSSYCEPDLFYGDLEVHHAGTLSPHFLGLKSVMALNNMEDIKMMPEFAKIRFLRTNTLHYLLSCPATELYDNCELYLKEYAKKDIGQDIPDSVEEFVILMEKAKDVFAHMALEGEKDPANIVLYDTIETVKVPSTLNAAIKKGKSTLSSVFGKKEKKTTSPGTDMIDEVTDKPIYKKIRRKNWALVGLSYTHAINSIGYAVTSKDVGVMEKLAIEKGRQEMRENEDKTWTRIYRALIILGAITVCI
ncbi:hypothetical protein EOM86_14855, partial [Candidatus Nomurabacteria bacterium]|nr:hypothetical protein [Candidatus Nomurabacteria bacterium]